MKMADPKKGYNNVLEKHHPPYSSPTYVQTSKSLSSIILLQDGKTPNAKKYGCIASRYYPFPH
jgi:hypothetical protein